MEDKIYEGRAVHKKAGKVGGSEIEKGFKCQSEEFVSYPRENREPQKVLEERSHIVKFVL